MARSAPSASHAAAFSLLPTVHSTGPAPRALATWMAMVPIPLDPPCTRNDSPDDSRATCTTFDQTVQATSGNAAAVMRSTPAGIGMHCPAGTATCSAYPPPDSSAHTSSPTDQPE